MSTSSSGNSFSRRNARRSKPPSRTSTNKFSYVARYDAYSYALRSAYLCHLLQPKARRIQHVPAPRPQLPRSSTNVTDIVRDAFVVRDSKSTRFPRAFMDALDRRLSGVVIGQEKMPEYGDTNVKRTFAIFLNEFKSPKFRSQVDKDRQIDHLLMIFISRTHTELMKTRKGPDDDSWKLMADRYVALFVRLISSVLKDNDWHKEKPELVSLLQSLETKLLAHDRDLAADLQRNGSEGSTTIEVDVPRSQLVKDMPMVQAVAANFSKALAQAQRDIDDQKDLWTEKMALRDLKTYQTSLSLGSRRSMRKDDFDTDEAYDLWYKAEVQDISHMILAVVQSKPDLSKSASSELPQMRATNGVNGTHDRSKTMSSSSIASPYTIDMPMDFGSLKLNGDTGPTAPGAEVDDGEPYMFIPPDPQAYYREVLKATLAHDMTDEDLIAVNGAAYDRTGIKLFSKVSLDLLVEIGNRWRVPQSTRVILLKDVVRELFDEKIMDLGTLEVALNYIRQPTLGSNKIDPTIISDRNLWPVADLSLNQQILTRMHDSLLRDFFEEAQQCFGIKPPAIGPILNILDEHFGADPMFSRSGESERRFTQDLRDALYEKARDTYDHLANKHLRPADRDVEFYDVIQLGKDVVKTGSRIQKRYSKNPPIMGVEPAVIFVEVVLPAYASDAREQITTIMDHAEAQQVELPLEDGFELYREMTQIREIHNDVLPDVQFALNIEDQLAPFVWRWIATTDQSIVGWVESAVKQDRFVTRNEDPEQPPNEEDRHSVSVIDIFRSFNEAIQQILQLEWADEYQYAKFMTALSKSIGNGVTRYCEMLERYFIQEMDRMTPEQEVATAQTRQEKWVKMAKDAMSTKEKMEPFQFLPESFVKLNNIEWAMLQLDRIEQDMKVDACAAAILKREPPQTPRQRKQENYVFTVKLIEAEDLKACDVNGLSDPYVVLNDGSKRLAKTRIIYGNLNPRWEETVDIITQGPLNIIATIWDWDIMGDHDMVGRTSIKLDPAAFRDFAPHEYWFDLDTQGRLLVRISMEGEKDDIRFYFGKTFRTLKRTEREMTRKVTDKLSAYIRHCLSRRTLRALTSRPLTISSVSNYFQRNRPAPAPQRVPAADIEAALQPLFGYFNDNFAIMKQTLTNNAMITVMTRLWKEALSTLESLLIPPLSDKPSAQRKLTDQEFEIVYKWLDLLFDFFHAYDDEAKVAHGVPANVLRSPKYHDLKHLNFFYYETYDTLVRTSERMTIAKEAQAKADNRQSAPISSTPFSGTTGMMMAPTTRRTKTVMNSRNLGTMRKAKQEKRQEAQAEMSDDMILRILRMHPEAERYLRDRSRQKQRLAAQARAEMIVQQSLAQGAARDRALRREMAMSR